MGLNAFAQNQLNTLEDWVVASIQNPKKYLYNMKLRRSGIEIEFMERVEGSLPSSPPAKSKKFIRTPNVLAATFRAHQEPEEFVSVLHSSLYKVESLWGKILVNGRVLWDIESDHREALRERENSQDDWVVDYGISRRVLSLVGRYLSVRAFSDSYGAGAAHDSRSTDIVAYNLDLGLGGRANLIDLVDEDSLVAALKNDSFVKKAAADLGLARELSAARTMSEIDKIMSKGMACEWSWPARGILSQFAILDYDAASAVLSVRIGLGYGCEAARGNLTQLGVKVKPTLYFAGEIETLAKSQSWVLMKNR